MTEAERQRIHGKLRTHAYPGDDLNWWQGALVLFAVLAVATFLLIAFT